MCIRVIRSALREPQQQWCRPEALAGDPVAVSHLPVEHDNLGGKSNGALSCVGQRYYETILHTSSTITSTTNKLKPSQHFTGIYKNLNVSAAGL